MILDYDTFILSLKNTHPPENLSDHQLSMWYALTNNWEDAHRLIQSINDEIAAWIHAYLHRLKGDINNANYWYKRANKNSINESLENEAKKIISSL